MEKLRVAFGDPLVHLTIESVDQERARQVARWLLNCVAKGAIPTGLLYSDTQTDAIVAKTQSQKRRGAAIAANLAAARRAGAVTVKVGGFRKR